MEEASTGASVVGWSRGANDNGATGAVVREGSGAEKGPDQGLKMVAMSAGDGQGKVPGKVPRLGRRDRCRGWEALGENGEEWCGGSSGDAMEDGGGHVHAVGRVVVHIRQVRGGIAGALSEVGVDCFNFIGRK
jgi:hypothetical protein